MPHPYISGARAWKINKKSQAQPVVVDFSKRTLDYDGKNFWIRFETQDKMYIYSLSDGQAPGGNEERNVQTVIEKTPVG